MVTQICPICGYIITPEKAYSKDWVKYCCKACATGNGQCECNPHSIANNKSKKY